MSLASGPKIEGEIALADAASRPHPIVASPAGVHVTSPRTGKYRFLKGGKQNDDTPVSVEDPDYTPTPEKKKGCCRIS